MDFLTAYMMNIQAGQAAATRNEANRRLDIENDERRKIQERADAQIASAETKETARKASGAAGFGGLRSGVEAQLRQGLITYEDAIGQLRGHGSKFELDPEEAVSNLTSLYTKELLPGRRATGIAAAYQDVLGREVKEEEKTTSMDRFNTGYYTSVQDLKDSLAKGVILLITMTQCMVKKKEILKVSEQVNEHLNLTQVFFLHMLQELKVKLVYPYRNLVIL